MIKVTVTGLTVGKNAVTLFMDNGEDMVLENTSWRTKGIVDDVIKPLATNGKVEIDLSDYSLATMLEKATGGTVTIVETAAPIANERADVNKTGRKNFAIQTASGTVINDGALLEKQIEQAIMGRTAKGFSRFLERFNAIERKHSMDDLLAFMDNGKMMIADDGCIVAFKRLNKRGELFYDCHTGTVPQRVGSTVCMDEADVDPSRSNSCSYGLHICSQSYLRSFSGSGLTLVKIDPKDVIAVPNHEKSKMRVMRYDIVAELDSDIAAYVTSGQSLAQHSTGKNILANVIAGKHVVPFEEVKVGKRGIKATIVGNEKQNVKVVEEKADTSALEAGDNGVLTPKSVKSIVSAAISGDMSAAITEGAKKVEKPATKKAQTKKTNKKAKKPAAKKAEPKKVEPKQSLSKKIDVDAGKFATYADKLEAARKLQEEGFSLREIAKSLGMDRESMSKNLKKLAS